MKSCDPITLRRVGSPLRTSSGASTGTSTSPMDVVVRSDVTQVLMMLRISAQRVADHKRDKDGLRARRRLVITLTREVGMIAPEAMSGRSSRLLPMVAYFISSPGCAHVLPDPSWYAVHQLTVASRRHNDGQGPAKREKDIRQAALLFEALQQTRQSADLALVYNVALERGPAWQEAIRAGAGMRRYKIPSGSRRS